MPNTAPIVLQCIAAAAWGAAGIGVLRRQEASPSVADRTLSCGLLLGAVVMGLDTLNAGAAAMPLASWALLAFAALGQLPGPDSVLHAMSASGWRRALAAIGLFLLLHWTHTTAPQQPVLDWGTNLLPLNLLAAAALGWLALRPGTASLLEPDTLQHGFERRTLLGATAAGLAIGAFGGRSASDIVAACQIAAVLPLLRPILFEQDRMLNLALATSIAATIPMALRSTSLANQDHATATTLLTIAVLFVVFGIALGLASEAQVGTRNDELASAQPLASPAPSETQREATACFPISMHALGTDLRDPITSMLAAADLLGDATTRKERDDHLGTIHEQARTLAASLADLEDFESLLGGELTFANDTFAPGSLLAYSISDVAVTAEQRGIEIRLDLSSDLPKWTQGDPSRLRQLATRLLELAVRHSNLGPVDLGCSFQNGLLHLVVQNQCPSTQLASFAPNGAKTSDFAQGIGISFCSHLALAMGGDLTIETRPEGGVTFHATVAVSTPPEWEIAIAEEDEQRAEPLAAPATTLSGHVLLVEDSRDHQRLLGHILTRAGATVTTADNGAIALHLLQNQVFDLILMDMQMPEMDGVEATEELRRRGVNTPILALTADNGENATERFLAAGCNGHIKKPIDREALHRMIGMYLPVIAPH